VWTEGEKKAIHMHSLDLVNQDQLSVTVMIVKYDEEKGVWYREGLVDLQPREWEDARPEMVSLRLA
jgi:hypothetical protein